MASAKKKAMSNNNIKKKNVMKRPTKKDNGKIDVIKREIIGVIIIAIASFLIFAVNQTSQMGIVGDWIKIILFAVFGKGMFILPYVIMLIGVLQLLNILLYSEKKQIISITGIFVCILIIIAIRDCTIHEFYSLDSTIVQVFKASIDYNHAKVMGGGLFGNLVSFIFIKLLGVVGTYILVFAFMLIFIILFTNQSLIGFFKLIFKAIKKIGIFINNFIFEEVDEDSVESKNKVKEKNIRKFKDKNIANLTNAEANTNLENQQNIKIFDYNSEHDDIKALQNKKITQLKIDDINVDNSNIHNDNKNSVSPNSDKKTSVNDTEMVAEPIKNNSNLNLNLNEAKTAKLDNVKIVDNTTVEQAPPIIEYKLPDFNLLNSPKARTVSIKEDLKREAEKLIDTLQSFNIQCNITQISKGPTITRYELQPAPGIKVSRITSLSNDLALSLATSDIRIEAPIPGKSAVGIEVPNKEKTAVLLRSLVESKEFKDINTKIPFALGKDISGKNIIGNIQDMPHLLVAGATGSGKSVCINTLIMSILYKARPDEVKLILVDPKVVELSIYNGIPHLLIPVVTDPRKASNALNWAVSEMTTRYKIFAANSVRDIHSYNAKLLKENRLDEKMPQIVIIIDELADLMQVAPGEVEESITRIAQLARACGIHLVIATQRPSVDVITGTIKANIPSRIAFAVSSFVDSRTILDAGGAEKLLGKGDMLYHPIGLPKPIRVQGTFISDDEIKRVVEYIAKQNIQQKINNINEEINKSTPSNEKVDELLEQAVELVVEEGQASASYLQRRFSIGYNRAARLIDALEERGIISGYEGSKPRKVLVTKEELEAMKE